MAKTISSEPLIKEVTVKAPVEKVWKAITDRDEMAKWYFDLAEFKPVVGFEFQFEGGKDGGKCYLHLCKITEVIVNKKITYSWRYDGYAGISFVTFELFVEGDETRIKLTHEGLDTFPSDNKDLARENFDYGWASIIQGSLKKYFEKN